MRRKDKEIKDKQMIYSILDKSDIIRIALCDNNSPYIVPMNFGIDMNVIYTLSK